MISGSGVRVTVLYNAPILPPEHPEAIAEADVIEVAQVVASALETHGFATILLAASPPIDATLSALRATAPDVVFNLIESWESLSLGATLATGLLELAGFACTGCPSEALGWCLAKSRAKGLLRGLELPTAPFRVLEPDQAVPEWGEGWPAFVKPDAEDASLGIDQTSIVVDQEGLARQVGQLRQRSGCGRVLIESYLPGPEYNVGVLALPDPAVLPISEVAYAPAPGSWPILTYAAKWVVGSTDDLASPIVCPAAIDDRLAAEFGRLAVAAFTATGCRDYARVDLRLDRRGKPMILEVNPNPDIGPHAGLARMLRASHRDYAATLAAITRQALARGPALGGAVCLGGRTGGSQHQV